MKPEKIKTMFFHENGYHFARWCKPIAPVVFGVDDKSLKTIKYAFIDVINLTPLSLSDIDMELGSNFLVFFCSKWRELKRVPKLSELITNLPELINELNKKNANQYRAFSFSSDGGIKFCCLLLKYDVDMASVPIRTLSVTQMLQSLLLWSPQAFKVETPIFVTENEGICDIKPFYKALLKSCYDEVLPNFSRDESHALRVHARVFKYLDGV